MDVKEAMKNQNDVAMILSRHVLSSASDNIIFSPSSINSAITMHAAGPGGDLVAGGILSYLRSSSLEELKSVFQEISSVVFADHSASGSPKITAANGLWIEKSLPVDPKFKDIFENLFKAIYAPVDFRSKVISFASIFLLVRKLGLRKIRVLGKFGLPVNNYRSVEQSLFN